MTDTRTPPKQPIALMARTVGVAIAILAVVAAVALAVTATPPQSWAAPADPSPTPGAGPGPSTGSSATSSSTPTPGPDQKCLAAPGKPNEVRWCFAWIMYDTVGTGANPTRWLTTCSKAKTVEEHDACDAVALTLASPPPDTTPSVLEDGDPDRGAPLVLCNLFADRAERDAANADRWTAKGERCKGLEAFYLAQVYVPAELERIENTTCDETDIECRVAKAVTNALAAGVRFGVQGLVDLTVQAMAFLLGELAKIVFDTTTVQTPDDTWYWTYNQIAGVVILLVFVFFIIAMITNGLRMNGPGPVSTLGGLVRAVVGISFAGGIAWVIVRAWDEATATLIDRNSVHHWDPSRWITAITGLAGGAGTAFLAFVIAVLAIFGLVLVFIQLWFRSILALAAGLYGAMAMAGEVKTETRHWGRRWFWTTNALASSKFWFAGFWIYGSRATYESDNLITALQGLTVIWLMVFAPAVMLRITSIWDGYLSDVNAHGMLSAVGHATGIGNMLDGAGSLLGGSGGGPGGGKGGGPGDAASGLMGANSAEIPTTPGQALGRGQAANNEAVDAVKTGQDGGTVGGAVSTPGGGGGAGAGGAGGPGGDDVGQPNADEAAATQSGTDSARHDLSSGSISAPQSGSGGSIPVAPPGVSPPGGGIGGGHDGGPGGGNGGSAAGGADGGAGDAAAGGAAGGAGAAAGGAGGVPIVPV